MKKIIVFLSGIYLAVFGMFQLVRFWPRYHFIMDQTPSLHRMFLAINFCVFSIFGLLYVVMGLGLIYRRCWAKNLLIVISSFALFFGASLAVGSTYVYFMSPYGATAISEVYNLYYWVYTLSFLIVMPAFFLIFFTRRSVKALFAHKAKS